MAARTRLNQATMANGGLRMAEFKEAGTSNIQFNRQDAEIRG
jgi:hypothetical protein